MIKEAHISIAKLASILRSNTETGLDEKEAVFREHEFGQNEINKKKKRSLIGVFFAQLNDKMILILLGAAIISAISSVFTNESLADSIIILFIVFINAIIGVVQESRAQKAIDALKKMTAPTAIVIRNKKETTIPLANVVPGDVIVIRAGGFVPADARIIEANELIVDESSLTGESLGVEKMECIINEKAHISEMKNIVFANTIVQSGYGKAMVFATGMNSYIGKIAKMIDQSEPPPTPLQKKLSSMGTVLGNGALIICVIIFIIGLIQNQEPKDMFLTSVSLAVAAIPEGLPAIVTVVLSLGIQRLAKKNAIVRNLPAVETLGCANIICSDKTGTITQNKMSVVEHIGDIDKLRLFGKLCNNKSNPTDNAIYSFCEAADINGYKRIKEVQFSSDRKIMSVVFAFRGGFLTITKGAPDVIFPLCSKKASYVDEMEKMSRSALRVIGVAYKVTNEFPINIEAELEFVGAYGLMDPPRAEVVEAVSVCRKAGVRTVMITGDHLDTAVAVAKKVGIFNGYAATENEIAKLDPKAQEELIAKTSVFARTTPLFKVKIVKALQKRGNVVAMTGDGINDAPSLRCADIGCGMGSGTDVAKSSSDMVLTNDNFSTIVEAVKYGRIIFDNLKKSICFLLSCNIGEILTILVAILAGIPSPLNAMQLLWINLVTDSLPAISLGVEKGEDDIMDHPPKSKNEGIVTSTEVFKIISEGVFIGLVSITAYLIGAYYYFDVILGSTMCFAVLSLSQLFHSFNLKSKKIFIFSKPFGNKALVFSFIICFILFFVVCSIPSFATLFGCCVLDMENWVTVVLLSISNIIFVDIKKIFSKLKRKSE